MDSSYKKKIIVPVIMSEKIVDDPDYPMVYLRSRFISRQEKIGSLTPIVVSVGGDDYGALFYILIDSNLTPISYYRMYGGISAGPDKMTDTSIVLPRDRHTSISGLQIHSYDLIETDWIDSTKNYKDIDSINYTATIDPSTGRITTDRLDSTHYRRTAPPLGK